MSNGPTQPSRPNIPPASDPSSIPAFDRAMRGLIHVPKSEVSSRAKPAKGKRPKR